MWKGGHPPLIDYPILFLGKEFVEWSVENLSNFPENEWAGVVGAKLKMANVGEV